MATLSDLDPSTLGRAAVDAVLERLARLVIPLSPGVDLRVGLLTATDTDLGLTVAQLCAWAQSGDLGDWQDHEDACDALQTTAEALLSSPLRPWEVSDLDTLAAAQTAPESDLHLLLACVLARVRIGRGEDVTLAELAALASVTGQRVRQLASAGEIVATTGKGATASTVTATEARRWLASRGLTGW